MIKILFVCRANICRSPSAEGVFKQLLGKAGLNDTIQVDSAGTDAPYPGRLPDQRARKVAADKGYDLSQLNAQQLTSQLAADSQYLVVMDDRNYKDALEIISPEDEQKMALLLSYSKVDDQQLPDPFFSGGTGGMGFLPEPVDSGERAFVATLEKIEQACSALLEHIKVTERLAVG